MRRVLLSLVFLCIGLLLYAQEPVRFGDREVYLEANVRSQVRGHKTSSLELGVPTGDRLNVLVQFEPGKIAFDALKQKGIELGDYLGSNAYYAKVAPGSRPSDFAGTGLRAVVPIRGEWKVVHSLLQGMTPEWAAEGNNIKVDLVWFSGVNLEQVKADLSQRGLTFSTTSDLLHTAHITATREQVIALADAEYVAAIRWAEPPMEFNNYRGARLSGAMNLRMSPELGGRGLTGKGVRIGIWDGNVAEHVDYGNRVHRQEFEISLASSGGHGMHTTGTILGAGLLDERARGMAPEAEIWTWNFNTQSNGKSVGQEMLECQEKYNISITSNSYGYRMSNFCKYEQYLNYGFLGPIHADVLAYYIPTLTHLYSAGNDQGVCNWAFGHMSNYAKNIISVGALTPGGEMTDFSSFGPHRDGRMFPIISARGESVYSVMPEQSYDWMSGTSMSCPTAAGHLALLTQRWGQLHGGALPFNYYLKALIANTADDKGNLGPDYKFGFGVLNSIAAVTAMENNWHHFASLPQGGAAQEKEITVPAGVKELRVAICWNDPVAMGKEYATGESPMVNDLDITVVSGGKTYYPYTLDDKHPEKPATADKKNGKDNIEQVVVKNPAAGKYTLKVEGKVNQSKKQDYVVVWYFDYQRPAITSPVAGDIYAPGDDIFLHTENLTAPLKVELTTDGVTYTVLKDGASLCDSIAIPATTASTDKATIRVTDKNNQMVQMSGNFTIMAQVQGLKLEEQTCSTTGWKLTWKAADGAAKYEVLRADVEKGTYVSLKNDVTTTEYALAEADVKVGERNVYAVRAVNANGVKGARSVGVIAQGAVAKTLQIADLPYTESFVGYPLKYATITKGKNVAHQLTDPPVGLGLPFDSHMLLWQAGADAPEWEDPFTKQRDNVGTVSACKVNLSGVAADTKLQLRAYYYMPESTRENGALLRLLVDGTETPDTQGRRQIVGDGEEHFVTYDLTPFAGKEVSLTFETALANNRDGLIIVYYQIYKTSEKRDAGIAWINDPKIVAKAGMQDETIRFKVLNYTSAELTNVPVSVQVDGKVVYTTTLASLKPFEDRILSFTHNFNSVEAHKFNVVARVDVEGDVRPTNNEKSFEVYNMGEVLPMPEVTYIEFWGMVFPAVPYVYTKIEGKGIFTDGRGTLEPYNPKEQAVLQVLPTTPGAVVQVTFKERDFAKDDILHVYTGDVPDNLKVEAKNANYKITGTSKEPLTIVSEASNGGLTFYFLGNPDQQADGWIAELSEVVLPDRWELTEVKKEDGKDANHKKLVVTAKNLLPIPFKNVPLIVSIDGVTQKLVIPELPANAQTNFTIPNEIDITAPMRAEVVAELGRDGDAANNKKTLSIVNDPIWNGGGIITTPETLAIAKFTQLNEDKTIALTSKSTVDYQHKTKIPFYTTTKNDFKFTLNNAPTAEQAANAAIRLFIDNDDNGELKDVAPECYKVALAADTKDYTLSVDLSSAVDIKPGDHRMRLLLANDADYAKFKEQKPIEWGHAVDFTATITKGASPFEYEMAIVGIEGIKSGRNGLTSATPVKVKLKNNGLKVVTSVDVKLEVDKVETATETLAVNLAAKGGEATVELANKANLSNEGDHTIKVSLTKPDSKVSDNTATLKVSKLPAISEKRYSLAFEAVRGEGMIVPEALGASVKDEATIEGWWKTEMPQTCAFLNGGDDGLYLGAYRGGSQYPANALVFFAGNGGYISTKGVLTNGVWHHVAAVVKQDKGVVTLKAYVDGDEVEMEQSSAGNGFAVTITHLNIGFKGENLMFRMWNKQRTGAEIKADMAKSVRPTPGGALPAGCVTELIYTEGMGKLTSFGDEGITTIVSKRTDEKIWKEFAPKLYSGIEVVGQVIPVKITGTEVVAIMPSDFTTFNKVKVKFASEWAGVEIKQNGTTVTENTELDFSASGNTLPFTLTLNILGKSVTENINIKLVKDKSNACDMLGLKMEKAKNTGLKQDITLTDPLATLVLLEAENESATSKFDQKNVVLQVTGISTNAKLYKGEVLQQTATDITVDLTTPVTFKVLAQNERDAKFYTVRLAMNQEITWETTKIDCNYGATQKFNATATSALPVTYVSANPNVATVDAEGNLVTVGVGTTKIVAKQEGDAIYKAAAEKEREVEVNRAPLTIKVKDATMALGEELPEFEFEYQGLVFPNTEWQFDAPYIVQNNDGTPATMPLAKGMYKIVPKAGTAPYESGNYMVTRTTGVLTVTDPVNAKKVIFVAKDEKDAPLEGVELLFGEVKATTGVDGKYEAYLLPLKDGKAYTVTATKAGYTSDAKEFEVKDVAQTVELKLLKEQYTLTYTTDANGLLQGVTSQKVAAGKDGLQVVAVPKDIKHRFKEWGDNHSTEAARTDRTVNADVTANAIFETFKYSLKYAVTTGGKFTTAEATKMQQVTPGENGVAVTVEAEAGYCFLGWSDGVMTLSRTDQKVMADLNVTARFAKPYMLTWTEDFEFNAANMETWSFQKPAAGAGWQIIPLEQIEQKNTGNVLALAPMVEYPPVSPYPLTWAASPWLSIEGHAATAKVVISFDRYVRRFYDLSVATLEYSFEDNVWVKALDIDQKVTGVKAETFTLDATKLGSHKHLRFRWAFDAAGGSRAYLAIDNVKVAYEAPTQAILRYYAGENGKLQKDGATDKVAAIELTTPVGTDAAKITAVPEAGYVFAKWSDEKMTAERQDKQDVTVTALFKRIPKAKHVIQYAAATNGTINGVAYQELEEGAETASVSAVANNGYAFKQWDDGKKVNPRSDVVGTEDKTYTAQFAQVFTLTYKAGEHGSIKGEATQNVFAGESGSAVEAVPDNGYRFVKWDDNKTDNPRTEVNVTESKTYTAQFELIPTYAVTLRKEGNGTLSISGYDETMLQSVPEGTELQVVVTPDAGWELKTLTAGGVDILATKTFTVTAATEVKAVFEQNAQTFAVTLKKEGEGELKITGIEESKLNAVPEGTELIAVATPKTGWKLKSLTAGTQDISSDGKFTVTADVEVKAVFEEEGVPQPKTYVVTVAKEGEGELKITGIEESKLNAVPEGTELTAVATPKTGWKLKSLMAGTQDIKADGKFTVTADVEVKAVFVEEGTPQPKTFAVTLKKEGEGELKITGIEEDKLNAVPEGTKLTAVATPKTGWKLKSLTAGTQDISSDGKFTVTADVEVKAVFVKSTSVDDAVFANVLVAPNPFTTQLRLVCNGATGRYDLLNASGVVVRSGNVDGNEVLVETTDLTSGLYLLRLTAESGATKVVTVVKE